MKHALITGGNKGIGYETTMMLLDLGYNVTVIARDISPVKGIKNCNGVSFDLFNVSEISKMISDIEPVDVLINNAGIMNTCNYRTYTDKKKNEIIKINLEAPVELITCVSENMIKKREGRIVNNASIAGQIGHPDIWYGISKAGLINATKSFAKELGSFGIIINAVAAGPVATDMLNTIPQARKDAILKSVFTGRFAYANEVAKAMVWLATESPEYINGTCIDINNGAYLR